MSFVAMRPPPSAAPGRGPAHIFFVSATVGFVATTGGGHYQQKVGYEPPTEDARIEMTADGGTMWRTLWRASNVVFAQIAFADRLHGAALGNVVAGRRNQANPAFRPFLLVTRDGGVHWRRRGATRRLAASWLQLVGVHSWFASGRRLLVSTDEGRSWHERRLPFGAHATTFVTPRVGYTAARGACGSVIWKTTHGGTSWFPLAGTCEPSYSSVDFLDARHGWVATGIPDSSSRAAVGPSPPLRIRRTWDGGTTWKTVFADYSRRRSWPIDTRLHFVDAQHGWAVSTEINQGFPYDTVHRTADGGRRWISIRYPAPPSAFSGSQRAWAGEGAYGFLWRTLDAGRSWELVARPENAHPDELRLATRTRLAVDTYAGTLGSTDGGRTWRSAKRPSNRDVARATGSPVYLGSRGNFAAVPMRTADGRPLPRPAITRYESGGVAFVDSRHGLLAAGQAEFGDPGRFPVFETTDGARTWHRIRVPPSIRRDDEVALGPGVVVGIRPPRLFFSTDAGRHWGTARVRNDFYDCGVSRPSERVIWVLCARFERTPSVLFRTDDGGSTWRRLEGPHRLSARVVAFDAKEAWAIDAPTGNVPPRALWHTTDGGRTWTQAWLSIGPGTRVRDLRGFGPHH
jgi:photosystem II stability/assembly factor-like uncharacterized protein